MAKRISEQAWKKAEALRKAGKSYGYIAKELGIPMTTLHDRSKKENWMCSEMPQSTGKGIIPLPNVLYLVTAKEFDGIYKIGITNNIDFRIKSMQTGCPYRLFAHKVYELDNPLAVEQSLHAFFRKKRLEGEWFYLTDQDLNYIHEALQDG
jgi:hypothetical protein